jgi:hypothetical protein
MHATAPFSADVYGAIAPDVTAFTVFVTVTDSRNSQSWEIYEFEVD